MSIIYQQSYGYRPMFAKNTILATREEAVMFDFEWAVDTISDALPDELEEAARTQAGAVFDALRFLTECKHYVIDADNQRAAAQAVTPAAEAA